MSSLRSDGTQASLREQTIDRMAEALWMSHEEMRVPGVVWIAATAALDALLDFLETHDTEWEDEAEIHWRNTSPKHQKAWIPMIENADRLAALRVEIE